MSDETVGATGSTGPAPIDETLVSMPAGDREGTAPDVGRGTLIGRYVVLSRLGVGAMGVVLAAYDPELDRKVALKLLKPRKGDEEAARARLLREAQALAKLNHPNVVGVHDVGVHAERVFVAMEFVEGETLRAWMRVDARPRSWREVVRVLEAAGRGLAAAHAVGIVHRDFKPDNVMVGRDGRVRVMDFGLAREDPDSGQADSITTGPRPITLTATGALMGTPSYMSPEQFGHGEVTARSDQFGFCVALHEALYGVRPFEGDTVAELVVAVSSGRRIEPSGDHGVPHWLHAVIARGLAVEPEDRFESMATLLAELSGGEGRRRARRRMVALVGVGVMGLGAWGAVRWDEARRIQRCVEAGRAIDEVWDADARESVRAGLLGTGVHYAADVAEAAPEWIERQAAAWREHAEAACLASEVHYTWTADTYDKAAWCLEQRRAEIETLVVELGAADEQGAVSAVQIAAGLTPVVTCMDERRLAVMAELPAPDLRERVRGARRRLSRVAYLDASGRSEEGMALAREVRAAAETIGWPPLTAAALEHEARLLSRTGPFAEAESVGEAAYLAAVRADAWDVAALAAAKLSYVVGHQGERPSEGHLWARMASVSIERAGDPAGLLESHRVANLASVHLAAGEYDQALVLWEQAIAIRREALGPEHPLVARVLNNLGTVLHARGEYERARQTWERARSIFEEALGPEHPAVVKVMVNLATAYDAMGEGEQAIALLERSLEIQLRSGNEEHPAVGRTLVNLGNALLHQGRPSEAVPIYERAIRMREATVGPEHSSVATALGGLGLAHDALGDHDEAARIHQRACSILERALSPEHPRVGSCLDNLGRAQLARGQPELAARTLERALATVEASVGPEHPDLGWTLTGLGRALMETGEATRALALLERALRLRARDDVDPVQRAHSELALAVALWDAPASTEDQRRRARQLATRARTAYESGGVGAATELAAAEAWLAAHAPEAITPSGDPRER